MPLRRRASRSCDWTSETPCASGLLSPACFAAAVARLSERLAIPVGELRGYGAREQTRSDHLGDVAAYLGWHQVDGPRWKDLEEFLFARAMEHDSGDWSYPAGISR